MKKTQLAAKTVTELRRIAKASGLSGYSSLKKAELVEALAAAKPSRATASKTVVPKKAAARKPAAKKAAPKKAAAEKPAPKKAAPKKAAVKKTAPGKAAPKKAAAKRAAPKRQAAVPVSDVETTAGRGLSPRTRRAFSVYRMLGEQRVTASKYYLGIQESPDIDDGFMFPDTHGENLVVLMVRDPYWLFAYWEFAPDLNDDLANRVGEDALRKSRLVLRVYDVTGTDADNPVGFHDIDVAFGARDWYINVTHVESEYCVDIGIILPDGTFVVIARSNRVALPPIGPSEEVDEKWVTIESLDEIYGHTDRGPTSGSGGWGSGGWGQG